MSEGGRLEALGEVIRERVMRDPAAESLHHAFDRPEQQVAARCRAARRTVVKGSRFGMVRIDPSPEALPRWYGREAHVYPAKGPAMGPAAARQAPISVVVRRRAPCDAGGPAGRSGRTRKASGA